MWIFQHDGEAGFSGIWTTITSARSFDSRLLQPPVLATQWVRYYTGSTANLKVGETITGGTGSGTATVIAQIIEQGTSAGNNAAGILLIRNMAGTAFVAGETLTGGTSSGTVLATGPAIDIVSHGPAKTLLITAEDATLQFEYSGLIPTVTGGSTAEVGMELLAGGSFILRGPINIRKFAAINQTNANNSIMNYVLHF